MRVGRYMDIAPERGRESSREGGAAPEASQPTDRVRDPHKMTTDEVRQGSTGHGVRYVLMISLGTSLVALAIAWVLVV